MSLSGISRWLSVAPLAGVERQGRGSVDGGGSAVELLCAFPVSSSTVVCGTHPFSILWPQFHQEQSLGEGSWGFVKERCDRARSFTFSRLLQPSFCGDESLRVVETSDRFVHPQSESPQDSLQDGDSSVGAPVYMGRWLDGVSRLEGRVFASSHPSGQSQIPQICGLETDFSIQGSLFRSLYCPAGFHTGHGSGFDLSSSYGHSYLKIPRQLAYPVFFPCACSLSLGFRFTALSGTWAVSSIGRNQISFRHNGLCI